MMPYNKIFEKFLECKNDQTPILQVYIAYVRYKEEKRNWIIIETERLKRRPNQEEMDMFVRTWTSDRIASTVRQSRDVLDSFRESVMEQYGSDLEEIAYENSMKRFESKIETLETLVKSKLKRSVWKEAGIGALGNFVWMVCTVGIVIIAAFIADADRVVKAFKILVGISI